MSRDGHRKFAFDKAYYERFYGNHDLRVAGQADTDRLARFVFGYLSHLDLPVARVLDLGCGVGYWQRAVKAHHPSAKYEGVELSDHLCETRGWTKGSVVTYRGEEADLVVCQGVLQYLTDQQAIRAIKNLSRHTRGALYLEALTEGDWAENCDREASDGDVYLRPLSFYQAHVGRHFIAAGGGVFLPRTTDVALFELERAWPDV